MNPSTLTCARAVRDGGIDAMAALDSALPAPLVGLPEDEARALKRNVGFVMAEIVDRMIKPAVRAFPEPAPDRAASAAIARERARLRADSGGENSPAADPAAVWLYTP